MASSDFQTELCSTAGVVGSQGLGGRRTTREEGKWHTCIRGYQEALSNPEFCFSLGEDFLWSSSIDENRLEKWWPQWSLISILPWIQSYLHEEKVNCALNQMTTPLILIFYNINTYCFLTLDVWPPEVWKIDHWLGHPICGVLCWWLERRVTSTYPWSLGCLVIQARDPRWGSPSPILSYVCEGNFGDVAEILR